MRCYTIESASSHSILEITFRLSFLLFPFFLRRFYLGARWALRSAVPYSSLHLYSLLQSGFSADRRWCKVFTPSLTRSVTWRDRGSGVCSVFFYQLSSTSSTARLYNQESLLQGFGWAEVINILCLPLSMRFDVRFCGFWISRRTSFHFIQPSRVHFSNLFSQSRALHISTSLVADRNIASSIRGCQESTYIIDNELSRAQNKNPQWLLQVKETSLTSSHITWEDHNV